jgi:hypothetical protein
MRGFTALLAAGLILCASGIATAGATAYQTVTYQVLPINELSVSGAPAALIVHAAAAGGNPEVKTDSATTYAITTNQTRKITGAIDETMPPGVTLTVNLTAPAGGTSAGDTELTTTPVNLVSGISKLNESGKTITYKLSATSGAGMVESATKTVILTIATP